MPFFGLREAEQAMAQVMSFGASLQWNPTKNVYVSPAVNVLEGGFDSEEYWNTLGDFNFGEETRQNAYHLAGYGLNLGFMSLIVAINVVVFDNSSSNGLRWFFSVEFLM